MKIINNKKKAMTLVELMISGLMVTIITLAILQFVNSFIKFDDQSNFMNETQEDFWLFNDIFTKDTYMAGFTITNLTTSDEKNPIIYEELSDDINGSSSINFSFENFDNFADCDGISNDIIINKYQLDDKKNLLCNNTKIMSNVNLFYVLYGVDINGDGIQDRYVDSINLNKILDGNKKAKPIIIKMYLITKSEKETSDYNIVKSFFLLNKGNINYNDKYSYNIFSNSYVLKNMNYNNN